MEAIALGGEIGEAFRFALVAVARLIEKRADQGPCA